MFYPQEMKAFHTICDLPRQSVLARKQCLNERLLIHADSTLYDEIESMLLQLGVPSGNDSLEFYKVIKRLKVIGS